MTRKYFGTDGIRGQANTFPMTATMALKVAMATASVLRGRRNGDQTDRVVIGKDTRLSGYMLEEAMCAGFVSMGMDAMLTGPLPTPGVSMLTRSLRCDLGVMISASHNAFQDNGIKLFGADGYKLDDEIEREIEANLDDDDLDAELSLPADLGKAKRIDDALGRYGEYIKGSFPKRYTLDGLKVVVDCAHGAAYKVAPQVLWELEAEVVAIGNDPNGRNINEGYGATATENLEKAVVEHGADVGIALDGDADRLIVVDETGKRIDGDQLMAALALDMKEQGILRGGALVSTVMSNLGLERLMEREGVKLIRTQVGDRYVTEAMRAGDYNVGGEQSGHIILPDFSRTGDGLLAALQILVLLKHKGKPASEVLNLFTPLPQILHNVKLGGAVDCGGGGESEGGAGIDSAAVLSSVEVRTAIAAAESQLANDGRLLVRASGTEALIRVMAEGDDPKMIESVVSDLCAVIEKVAG